MKFFQSTLLASLFTLITAGPILTKRTASKDAVILNYALALEHLERAFYTQGMKNFTPADFAAAGFPENVYGYIQSMSKDEITHVDYLTEAIKSAGAQPVSACTYNFGITTVKDFAVKAAMLEGVGVSAYLGASKEIMDQKTLAATQTILAGESHHSSLVRKALGKWPLAHAPHDPLNFNEVYSLAAPYISRCPTDDLQPRLKTFPQLELARYTRLPVEEGHTIILELPDYRLASHSVFAAFITVNGPIFTNATVFEGGWRLRLKVPSGVQGQSYVVATSSAFEVSDSTTLAGPAVLDVGGWF